MTFDGRRIHLHHFGILPEFQGNRLAKKLLKESLDFVKKKDTRLNLRYIKPIYRQSAFIKNQDFKLLGDYEIYIIRDISKI